MTWRSSFCNPVLFDLLCNFVTKTSNAIYSSDVLWQRDLRSYIYRARTQIEPLGLKFKELALLLYPFQYRLHLSMYISIDKRNGLMNNFLSQAIGPGFGKFTQRICQKLNFELEFSILIHTTKLSAKYLRNLGTYCDFDLQNYDFFHCMSLILY